MLTPTHDVLRDLAPSGTLRAAINFGNPVLAQRNSQTGEPQGVSVRLATELARQLGVAVTFVTYDAAGKVFDALASDQWDVAFLAIEPVREAQVAFSEPYVIIEGTYLVQADSAFVSVQDLDQPGVRIAVGQGAAYDLFLSRTQQHAELVRAPTSAGAVDLFLQQGLDAAAGVRQPLLKVADTGTGLRVLDGHFTSIRQAMGVPVARTAGAAYVRAFLEPLKANGFVRSALDDTGQRDVTVAPAQG
ncbi:ABC transporter substrate-binding protein [Pseudomonas atacamensis]|uniref:ABC transporter substrate-binding protein n=1 Tax=Pseudomonas atacamensis TaxID=2565368 RepID=UPI002448DF6A|nr:ABC transporter substrate-binding protein [Pseudomonas atacamensis]MDH2076869.1 ABC transporter substrate-binding protein [Pseudomonas atacamensis]